MILSSIIKQSLSSIDQGTKNAEFNVGFAAGYRSGIGILDTLVSEGLLVENAD